MESTDDSGGSASRLYLIRHAKAGSREGWTGPDLERPLTDKGERQADAISEEIFVRDGSRLFRVLTSPAVRCRDTVRPLAKRTGLEAEEVPWLLEGSDPAAALGHLGRIVGALGASPVARAPGEVVAACTHGDIVWGVLDYLARSGVELGHQPDAPKGGVWVLDYEGHEVANADLLPPPER